jgi:hypothetical protein
VHISGVKLKLTQQPPSITSHLKLQLLSDIGFMVPKCFHKLVPCMLWWFFYTIGERTFSMKGEMRSYMCCAGLNQIHNSLLVLTTLMWYMVLLRVADKFSNYWFQRSCCNVPSQLNIHVICTLKPDLIDFTKANVCGRKKLQLISRVFWTAAFCIT